jgi:DNA polymerase (family X)
LLDFVTVLLYIRFNKLEVNLTRGESEVHAANAKVATVLDELVRYTKESGDSGRAFGIGRAANAIRNHDRDVSDPANLTGIKGVGPSTITFAKEILETGTCSRLEELRVLFEIPDLSQLQRIPGVGPVKAKSIWKEYGITTLQELRSLVDAEKFVEVKVITGLEFVERSNEYTPRPWAEAAGWEMIELLKPFAFENKISFGGSIRRKADKVRDIDIIIACTCDPSVIYEAIQAAGKFAVQYGGSQKIRVEYTLFDGKVIGGDVLMTSPEEWPCALNYLTGSKVFNPALRAIAQSKGFTLNEHRLLHLATGNAAPIKEEYEIFQFLGIPYVPAECRRTAEDAGKDFSDVLAVLPHGELHIHTTWSDGIKDVRGMLEEALRRDFSFYGISDHTKALPQGVPIAKMREYAEEIHYVGSELGIKAYAGLELDINAAHQIVYPQAALKGFLDYVILAVHHAIGSNMVPRYLSAIEQVDGIPAIIAHVTGRLFGLRDATDEDWGRLFEVCAEKNILIELNGQADRLDPSIDLIRQAKTLGCKFVVATDDHGAHDDAVFINAWYMARAAGLTREDMIITADDVKNWLRGVS